MVTYYLLRVLFLPPAFHDGFHPFRQPPSSQSRVHQATQLRTDGIRRQRVRRHRARSPPGSSSNGCCLFRNHIDQLFCASDLPHPLLVQWACAMQRAAPVYLCVCVIILSSIEPQPYPVIYAVANPVSGPKEVRRSTVHIVVTARHSNLQGSKPRQNPCQVRPPENIGSLSASTRCLSKGYELQFLPSVVVPVCPFWVSVIFFAPQGKWKTPA